MNDSRDSPLEAALKANAVDLLRYFQRRTAPETAADLLAETMLTAWRREEDHPAETEAGRKWLFGIAGNVLKNAGRTRRRRNQLISKLTALLGTHAESHGADEGLEVRDAVQRLDPELRELIRLVHWEGFTVADAGQILGVTASTARGRYQRAKIQLRETLEDSDSPTPQRCSATLPQVDPRFFSVEANPDDSRLAMPAGLGRTLSDQVAAQTRAGLNSVPTPRLGSTRRQASARISTARLVSSSG